MKKIFALLLFLIMVNSMQMLAQYKLDSLECLLFEFLITKGDYVKDSNSNETMLIINDIVTLKKIENQEFGIFKFGTLTSHSYFHLLLKDKDKFTIVDLKQPFEKIVPILIKYFQRNSFYSREEILNYFKKATELYLKNQAAIPWKLDD